jgi:hypothetical protein
MIDYIPQRSVAAAQVYGWIFNFLPTILSVTVILITNSAIFYKLMQPTKRARRPSIPLATVIGNQTVGNLGTVPEDSIAIENGNLSTVSKVKMARPSISQQIRQRVSTIENKARNLAGKRVISGHSKTIFCLATLYLVCYAQKVFLYGLVVAWPNKKFHELLPLHMTTEASELFFRISDYCVTINSFLNPIIYFAFSSKIRREFLHVLSCGRAGTSHSATAISRGQSNIHTNTYSNTNTLHTLGKRK